MSFSGPRQLVTDMDTWDTELEADVWLRSVLETRDLRPGVPVVSALGRAATDLLDNFLALLPLVRLVPLALLPLARTVLLSVTAMDLLEDFLALAPASTELEAGLLLPVGVGATAGAGAVSG